MYYNYMYILYINTCIYQLRTCLRTCFRICFRTCLRTSVRASTWRSLNGRATPESHGGACVCKRIRKQGRKYVHKHVRKLGRIQFKYNIQ